MITKHYPDEPPEHYAELSQGWHTSGPFDVEIEGDNISKVRVIDWPEFVAGLDDDEYAALKAAMEANQ